MGKAHPHHGLAGLDQGQVYRHVGLGPTVGLDVHVLRAKDRLAPIPGQVLGHVHEGAAAVVPFARITFGILVGHHVGVGLHHRQAGEVLGGDQLQAVPLPF